MVLLAQIVQEDLLNLVELFVTFLRVIEYAVIPLLPYFVVHSLGFGFVVPPPIVKLLVLLIFQSLLIIQI